MIIILPETSIRISRNKFIINYISCVEIQSAQGENTGTWTDQISIQFPDTTDPLKLGPIIIDVKQSNCQSHLRLTPVKINKKSDQIKLWSFMKTIERSSFLSKLWYFQYKSKQRVTVFLKWTDFSECPVNTSTQV